MAKNENRKKFLKHAGILGAAGLFSFSKLGRMQNVHAEVSDNSEHRDISEDIIYCTATSEQVANSNAKFASGSNAKALANAANALWVDFRSNLTNLLNTPIMKKLITGYKGGTIGTPANTQQTAPETFPDAVAMINNYTSEDPGIIQINTGLVPTEGTKGSTTAWYEVPFSASSVLSADTPIDEKFHQTAKFQSKGTLEITQNGTRDCLGYDAVKVNVSNIDLTLYTSSGSSSSISNASSNVVMTISNGTLNIFTN